MNDLHRWRLLVLPFASLQARWNLQMPSRRWLVRAILLAMALLAGYVTGALPVTMMLDEYGLHDYPGVEVVVRIWYAPLVWLYENTVWFESFIESERELIEYVRGK